MKYVVVTGANKGIGFAVVQGILGEMSDLGVILCSRNLQRGQDAVERLSSLRPDNRSRIKLVELDMTSNASINGLAPVLAEVGPSSIEGLVNNAGIATGSAEQILGVNVKGLYAVTKEVLPFIASGGRVVNVASASGPNYVANSSPEWQKFFTRRDLAWSDIESFLVELLAMSSSERIARGLPDNNFYGASKACVNLYTRTLAREYPSLAINSCTPGFIKTDLVRTLFMQSKRSLDDADLKQPEHGARVVLRLLSKRVETSGNYYGSDGLRSPLDCYRAPGSPEYLE